MRADPCAAASQGPHRLGDALRSHHIAGVRGEAQAHSGDGLNSVEVAVSVAATICSHVVVRVPEMTNQPLGMIDGPIVSRINGTSARCSLVSEFTWRSEPKSGLIAMIP